MWATALALVLAACGATSPGGPGAPPNDYLATGSGWVDYIQWDASGTGTFTEETLTGTAPNETVQSSRTPISVTVNGTSVDFTGLSQQQGTLSDGTLTLQVLASDGTLGTDTFTPAGQDTFNQAVGALQAQAASDNSAAVQQQAQASRAQASASATAAQASANAQAQQAAQADLSTLQGVSFSGDLSKLAGDVSQTDSDLAKEKSDAAAGVDGPGGPSCYNLEQNVDYDATQNVEYDATQNLGYDLQQNLSPDISTARGDITTLNNDLSSLSASGLPAPAGASAAIAAAKQTISQAINQANGYIDQVNADVNTAYAIGNNMATGTSCSGPGLSPSPISHLS